MREEESQPGVERACVGVEGVGGDGDVDADVDASGGGLVVVSEYETEVAYGDGAIAEFVSAANGRADGNADEDGEVAVCVSVNRRAAGNCAKSHGAGVPDSGLLAEDVTCEREAEVAPKL